MVQPRRDLDLSRETLHAHRLGQFRAQHLDRYLAVVLGIVRQIDRRHAARAQLAHDAVALRQDGGNAREVVVHRGSGRESTFEKIARRRGGRCTLGFRRTASASSFESR